MKKYNLVIYLAAIFAGIAMVYIAFEYLDAATILLPSEGNGG